MGVMVPSSFIYSFREALRHFRRNFGTCFGAVVTIFLSLFMIGLFVMTTALVNSAVGNVESQVTINAFLADSADKKDVTSLQDDIALWPEVRTVDYLSKEQALATYKKEMSNKNAADAVAALDGQNPIPASLVIKLDKPQQVETVANRLIENSKFKAVADDTGNAAASVQYGRPMVERLFSVTNCIRIIALVLVVLLTFIAFVFISNTIRLAIAARRREIAIERLVGASNSFIRGPFVTEGVLEAILGAFFAILAVEGVRGVVLSRLNSLSFLFLDVSPETVTLTYIALVIVGILLGFFGSAIAMRRYLRI